MTKVAMMMVLLEHSIDQVMIKTGSKLGDF